MLVLDSVQCKDTFPGDAGGGAYLLAQGGSNGGYFSILSADVMLQLAYSASGNSGQIEWTDPVHVAPGNGILEKGTLGIRFRNYTPGKIAVVSAGLSGVAEPSLQLTAAGVSAAAQTVSSNVLAVTSQTASVTINTTSEAAAVSLFPVSGAASVNLDGSTRIAVVLYCPAVVNETGAGNSVNFWLYQDGASIGRVFQMSNEAANATTLVVGIYFESDGFTPSAGVHTYDVRASLDVAGSGTALCGTGGLGNRRPMYLRVVAA